MAKSWENFYKICHLMVGVFLLILIWDIQVLKVPVTWDYIVVKIFIILGLQVLGWMARRNKSTDGLQIPMMGFFFFYCFYGVAFWSITYYQGYIEGFLFFSFVMVMNPKSYFITNGVAFLSFLGALSLAKEPSFIAMGASYKPHILRSTGTIFVVSCICYSFLYKYRALITSLNDKFALIGRQSSFLMHEVKSPLTRLLWQIKQLPPIMQVEEIERNAHKITSLVNSLEIMIGKSESFKNTFEEYDLAFLVQEFERDLGKLLRGRGFDLVIEGFEGKVHGNKYLFYQVIKNLATNALEAVAHDENKKFQLNMKLTREDHHIHLLFSNTGSIIPKKHLERIFEPMFTTKTGMANKGFGLSFCKNIVEAHEGKIEVHSDDNMAAFKISLPLIQVEQA